MLLGALIGGIIGGLVASFGVEYLFNTVYEFFFPSSKDNYSYASLAVGAMASVLSFINPFRSGLVSTGNTKVSAVSSRHLSAKVYNLDYRFIGFRLAY